jgi:hypothetical protein
MRARSHRTDDADATLATDMSKPLRPKGGVKQLSGAEGGAYESRLQRAA